jgi:hypothetical protein
MAPKDALTLGLGVLGLAWYYLCLLSVGWKPLPPGQPPNAFRQFMSLSITTIGVSLATFVGMLLGVNEVKEQVAEAVRANTRALSPAPSFAFPTLSSTDLQWIAGGLYVLSLLIALWLWRKGGDDTDPAVSNLAKSILGLIGGALSILLNLQ